MARNERHVVKNPRNGWDIKKPQAWRPCGHAQTRAEAVILARENPSLPGVEGARALAREGPQGADSRGFSRNALKILWLNQRSCMQSKNQTEVTKTYFWTTICYGEEIKKS